MRGLAVVVGMLAATAACGDDYACIDATVTWEQYVVPDDLDRVHFEVRDDEAVVAEKSFALTAGEMPASITLCQGPRTPDRAVLIVYGVLGETLVTQSDPTDITFEPGLSDVEITLP